MALRKSLPISGKWMLVHTSLCHNKSIQVPPDSFLHLLQQITFGYLSVVNSTGNSALYEFCSKHRCCNLSVGFLTANPWKVYERKRCVVIRDMWACAYYVCLVLVLLCSNTKFACRNRNMQSCTKVCRGECGLQTRVVERIKAFLSMFPFVFISIESIPSKQG